MTTHTQSLTPRAPWTVARLVRAAARAAALATAADLLVYFVVPAAFDLTLAVPLMGPGSPIVPLPAAMVVFATVLPALAGAALLGVLYRLTARPLAIFRIIAAVVLLISLVPLPWLPVPLAVRLTLASMHVIAAAAVTYGLTSAAVTK